MHDLRGEVIAIPLRIEALRLAARFLGVGDVLGLLGEAAELPTLTSVRPIQKAVLHAHSIAASRLRRTRVPSPLVPRLRCPSPSFSSGVLPIMELAGRDIDHFQRNAPAQLHLPRSSFLRWSAAPGAYAGAACVRHSDAPTNRDDDPGTKASLTKHVVWGHINELL